MYRLSVCRCVGVGLVLCVILLNKPAGAAIPLPAQDSVPSVALKFKLVGNPDDQVSIPWLIELRNAAGVVLRRATNLVGDTVQFKNLVPGIYRICLLGRGGRKKAESIDLNPIPGGGKQQFETDVRVPESGNRDPQYFRVDVRTLSVPREAREEVRKAEKEGLKGNQSAVRSHLQRAIDLCPQYVNAWNNLGAWYHHRGDYQEAIRIFTKVTELDPDFFPGWKNLGAGLLATAQFREALNASLKALSLDDGDAETFSQLAMCHYYLQDYENARIYFMKVLELDPDYPKDPRLYLAHVARMTNKPDEAMAFLYDFLKHHPNSPQAASAKRSLRQLSEGTVSFRDVVRK